MVMMGVQVRAMIRSEPRYLRQEASLEAGIVWRSRNWKVAEKGNLSFCSGSSFWLTRDLGVLEH